jgi:serine/threonine-protein phosphatase 2A regulatory subunit B''
MDLLAFADFVLAWDHRNHAASVGYFFKIFDIQHKVSVLAWTGRVC